MNVFIRPNIDTYEWFLLSSETEAQAYSGSLEELLAFYQQQSAVSHWVLVIPAVDTSQCNIPFTDKERKHIIKAIPFLLEDDLLTDAQNLHIVADKPADNHISVVAIDKSLLEHYMQEMATAGIHLTHCMPEVKLLLEGEDECEIFYHANQFILRHHDGRVMAFEELHFPLVLQVLTEGFAALPKKMVLIADDEASLERAWESIPATLHDIIDARMLAYPLMINSRFNKQVKTWNLLKGQFAYAQQWLSMIQPWKWVLVSFFAALMLNMGMLLVEYRQLTVKNAQATAEIQSLVRKVIPRGQIVNPRKQLQHELDLAQQGGSGGFMQKLQKIGSVLSKHQIQTMNSLNYEKDKNEIRMDVVVPNYDQLQAIINELQQVGLNADIQNSNAQGEQLRARIRISG